MSVDITIKEDKLPGFVKEALLPLQSDHNVFAFYGDLGAGKTTLIKEICFQLGIEKSDVNSPTFALVNEYDNGNIFHFDFYRLEDETEAYDIGFEEYLDSGNLCLIEWPERIENLLPPDTVKIVIQHCNFEERNYKVTGT
jgi:tRNA threonylcarbamoyladenosine biosynthesis protein TsaE